MGERDDEIGTNTRASVRAQRDWIGLWARRHWALALSVSIALISALVYLAPRLAAAVGVAGAGIGVLLSIRDLVVYRSELRDLKIIDAEVRPFDEMSLSGTYDGYVRERTGSGDMLRSRAIDLMLAGLSASTIVRDPPFELPSIHSDLELVIVRHERKSGHLVFNGKGMRMESDLTEAACRRAVETGEGLEVEFREMGFFANLVTNRFYGRQVVSQANARTEYKADELFLDESGMIRDLAHSWMANLVGISTIAICSDQRVLLVHQTRENADHGGMLAPSGSGSLEPRDFDGNPSLGAAIAAGMERELREECNLSRSVDLRTTLTGFGRWLDRGGKPEFFGVTEVDLPSNEIAGMPVRREEAPFVGKIKISPLDAVLEESEAGTPRTNWAFSLAACLKRLRENEGVLSQVGWRPGVRM